MPLVQNLRTAFGQIVTTIMPEASYLDTKFSWHDFTKYAEILDRLMPGDLEELRQGDRYNLNDADVTDALLRLVSLGLVITHSKGATVPTTVGSISIPDSKEKDYTLTPFGKQLLDCLEQ